jgi:signal transduction histidine kinase
MTQAHNLDRMKSEFLSLAAHELRTPLTSIYGFVELMVGREIPEAKRQNMLTRIHRQCKLMINILNELLDLARIEARGNSDFKFGMLDLAQVVDEFLADFKPPEGRARPQVEMAHVPTQVCIDPQKMQQILHNTLSNAYKYSPEGAPVKLRFVRAEKQLTEDETAQAQAFCGLEIRDQGIGLSAEHLARMGERFFRADTSGHIPGTGLNVSIVKELMELMGGEMQVESELGKGTCITLWFKC